MTNNHYYEKRRNTPRLPIVYTTAKIILMACKPVLWSEMKND